LAVVEYAESQVVSLSSSQPINQAARQTFRKKSCFQALSYQPVEIVIRCTYKTSRHKTSHSQKVPSLNVSSLNFPLTKGPTALNVPLSKRPITKSSNEDEQLLKGLSGEILQGSRLGQKQTVLINRTTALLCFLTSSQEKFKTSFSISTMIALRLIGDYPRSLQFRHQGCAI
jgi:hypothetical protein